VVYAFSKARSYLEIRVMTLLLFVWWRDTGDKFHDGPVTALIHHPSQPWLLTGAADGQSFLVHTESGKVRAPDAVPRHFFTFVVVLVSPMSLPPTRGQISTSFSQALYIASAYAQILASFRGHQESVESVGFCAQYVIFRVHA
jgi:hypothetical protein